LALRVDLKDINRKEEAARRAAARDQLVDASLAVETTSSAIALKDKAKVELHVNLESNNGIGRKCQESDRSAC